MSPDARLTKENEKYYIETDDGYRGRLDDRLGGTLWKAIHSPDVGLFQELKIGGLTAFAPVAAIENLEFQFKGERLEAVSYKSKESSFVGQSGYAFVNMGTSQDVLLNEFKNLPPSNSSKLAFFANPKGPMTQGRVLAETGQHLLVYFAVNKSSNSSYIYKIPKVKALFFENATLEKVQKNLAVQPPSSATHGLYDGYPHHKFDLDMLSSNEHGQFTLDVKGLAKIAKKKFADLNTDGGSAIGPLSKDLCKRLLNQRPRLN